MSGRAGTLGSLQRWVDRLERLVVPPMQTSNRDDFRRVVTVIALAAVAFFVPSLALAHVPAELWLQLTAVALAGAALLAGSLFFTAVRPELALILGLVDAVAVAVVGYLYRGYYNEIPLLFALVVAALAIVHGLIAAAPAIVLGAVLVPLVVDASPSHNPTDFANAALYLAGIGVVPWAAARLAAIRARDLEQQLRVTRAAEREAVVILTRAAAAKDEETGEHVDRVGDLTARLAAAAALDAESADALRLAAALHDVGKLHVPDRILLKPGRLSAEEWEIMRRHTVWGARILGDTESFALARRICRSHHENWNGSGYPDGLCGEGIPIEARLVRITDTFDALRSPRPYKPAWSIEQCLEELRRAAGSAFDPELVATFLGIVEALPTLDVETEDATVARGAQARWRRRRLPAALEREVNLDLSGRRRMPKLKLDRLRP